MVYVIQVANVEFCSENKFEKLVHLVVFIIRTKFHLFRGSHSTERQTSFADACLMSIVLVTISLIVPLYGKMHSEHLSSKGTF